MDDRAIIDLYWERSERAIGESGKKYGRLLYSVADRILHSPEDSEECVNDTWLRAWNAMPPARPEILSAFFAKITRNLSLNRLEKRNAKKRGSGEAAAAVEELSEILADTRTSSPEGEAEMLELTEILNRFLADLPKEKRQIFLKRYWYLCSVREIAAELQLTESKVKMTLLRTREKLAEQLKKEGYLV